MQTRHLFIINLIIIYLVLGSQVNAGSSAVLDRPAEKLPEIKKNCGLCHGSHNVKKGAIQLKKPIPELCIDCHKERIAPNEHKVGIVPPINPQKLPLHDGKITCMTCHDPHQNVHGGLLRLPERELCSSCHPY